MIYNTATRLLPFAVCLALLPACSGKTNEQGGSPPGDAPASAKVEVKADTLLPDHVTIRAGGQVTWLNEDDIAHHLVTNPDESTAPTSFDSDQILGPPGFEPFRQFSVTFDTTGKVVYYDVDHPTIMVGTVTVR